MNHLPNFAILFAFHSTTMTQLDSCEDKITPVHTGVREPEAVEARQGMKFRLSLPSTRLHAVRRPSKRRV